MIEKSEKQSELGAVSVKSMDVKLEVQGPMRHLLKGQDKTTTIQRMSIFRGKVEQTINKQDIIAFENALETEKSKKGFIRVIYNFMERDRLKRGHLSFIYTALNYLDAFGLEKELDVYNEILEVLPKYKIINRTLLDALWPKPHPQIDAALDLLTKMEDNRIRPDDLTYTILMEVFGKASFPVQKVQRMAFWFDRYENANPYLLSEDDLKDRYKVCELALRRITMDEENIKVYSCEDAEDDVYGKSFLIGFQNEEQKEFLATHDTSKTLYLEGPFYIWMNHIREQYFVLRSEPLHIENPLTHEDDTRVREGMTLGICMSNKMIKDALHSWLKFLEKDNPRLSDFRIIFNVSIPNDVVPSS